MDIHFKKLYIHVYMYIYMGPILLFELEPAFPCLTTQAFTFAPSNGPS